MHLIYAFAEPLPLPRARGVQVLNTVAALAEAGATVTEVDLPHSRHAIEVYYLVATAEASSNLARFDGVRYGARVAAPALGAMYDATRGRGFGDVVLLVGVVEGFASAQERYDRHRQSAGFPKEAAREALRAFPRQA